VTLIAIVSVTVLIVLMLIAALLYRQRHQHKWTYPPGDSVARCCLTCGQVQERSDGRWKNMGRSKR